MAIVNILPEDYPTPPAWRTSIKQRDHVMAALDGPPDSKAADHLMAATDPDDDDPTCAACQGTGYAGPDRDCPVCGGRGWRDDTPVE